MLRLDVGTLWSPHHTREKERKCVLEEETFVLDEVEQDGDGVVRWHPLIESQCTAELI